MLVFQVGSQKIRLSAKEQAGMQAYESIYASSQRLEKFVDGDGGLPKQFDPFIPSLASVITTNMNFEQVREDIRNLSNGIKKMEALAGGNRTTLAEIDSLIAGPKSLVEHAQLKLSLLDGTLLRQFMSASNQVSQMEHDMTSPPPNVFLPGQKK